MQEVEIAITCLYELGEGMVDQIGEAQCGAFRPSVQLLMTAPIPHARHRLVAGAVLESYVRYVKVAASDASLVPNVRHPASDVFSKFNFNVLRIPCSYLYFYST